MNPESRRIVAVIPSRFGSTRFAGKPLARIRGIPMIQRVYRGASRAAVVSDVVVATDDPRIRDAVEGFGGRVIMTDPSCRSGTDRVAEAARRRVIMTDPSCRSGTDRVAEAARRMGLAQTDILINVQGDQPLIHPDCLEEVIRPFDEADPPGMTTLAFRIVNPDEIVNPKDVKVVWDRRGNALYFSRSPIPLGRDPDTRFDSFKHLGVYGYTRDFLDIFTRLPPGELEGIEKLEQLRALEHGYPILVVVTRHDSPEVDLPEDIARIESIMEGEQE